MKYRSLMWAIGCGVIAGLLPPAPIVLVKAVIFLLGVAAGLNLAVFLIAVFKEQVNASR